jgi:energy-coupling factor transport system substrate-specific component
MKFRAIFSAAIILAAAVLCFAAAEFSQKSAALITLICSAAAILLLFARVSRRADSIFISLTAVMTALSVVGRLVFAPISGFKPCTAVVIITGMTLGADAGFICGALTALISNLYFGQGIWTIFQMISWGLIGLISGIAAKPLARSRIFLYAFGAFSGVLYSAVMDFFSVLWQDGGFNAARFAAYAAGSLAFSAMYAASNVIFLALLYRRMSQAVCRVVRKYGLDKNQA